MSLSHHGPHELCLCLLASPLHVAGDDLPPPGGGAPGEDHPGGQGAGYQAGPVYPRVL